MSKPYSEDLRLKALNLIDTGKNVLEVVKLLEISKSSLYLWLQLRRNNGNVAPKKPRRNGHNHKIKDLNAFRNFVNENHDLTSKEMAQKWGNISGQTICKWLNKIGYTRKKKLTDIKNDAKRSVKYIWTT